MATREFVSIFSADRFLTFRIAQFELSDPPSDAISAVKFATNPAQLLVSSWDKNVYLYQLESGSSWLAQKFEHRAPVLDVCWGPNEDEFYSGGLDWDVRRCVLARFAGSLDL